MLPLIQLLSLVLVFALPAVWSNKVFTATPVHYERVIVRPGDTVWTLVSRRSDADNDVGEAVYRVAQINHLKPNSHLTPGTVLLLPR